MNEPNAGALRRPERPAPFSTDGSNAFARFSMQVRVPRILEEVIDRNSDYPRAVKAAVSELARDIASDVLLPPLAFPAPDETEWQPVRSDETWLATEWFFAECYVYRCLTSAVRYWETGRDPFAPAKRDERASDRLWTTLEAAFDSERFDPADRIAALLTAALWQNRMDLSYAVGTGFGASGAAEDLLVDDRRWAIERLLDPGGDLHLVADNGGCELSMDLALADALMTLVGARVSLHVKMHPMFVSDAVARDVWDLLEAMRSHGGRPGELASRLSLGFDSGRLRILPDFFWNGPRFLGDRPARIARELDGASLVVLKGDANYRRAVGDAAWAPDVSFAEAVGYFPAPLLSLRTMKSDALAGVPIATQSRLDREDPEWRINGRRGLIQGNGSST